MLLHSFFPPLSLCRILPYEDRFPLKMAVAWLIFFHEFWSSNKFPFDKMMHNMWVMQPNGLFAHPVTQYEELCLEIKLYSQIAVGSTAALIVRKPVIWRLRAYCCTECVSPGRCWTGVAAMWRPVSCHLNTVCMSSYVVTVASEGE